LSGVSQDRTRDQSVAFSRWDVCICDRFWSYHG